MPCTRRPHHAGAFRFHPYFAAHPAFHPFACPDLEEEVSAMFGKNKSTWDETDDSFTFQMDVPGVQEHNVTIEETDGEMEITAIRMDNENVGKIYQEVLFVHPNKAKLAKTKVTLEDGVLSVVVPKKNADPVDLVAEAASPPDSTGEEFRIAMDLPGVKPSDLKLQVRDDKVHLEANRTVGGRTFTTKRSFDVEPANTDISHARAFLQDGVFTLVAPVGTTMEEDGKVSATRRFVVNAHVPPSLESLDLEDKDADDETTEKEGKMVVETVEEEKGWEQVDGDAKKPAARK